ncbi:enoyl-CoA hydratase/isomerase family protein [Lentzea aerocolonigenes]|uniref:enoyl-CoA hydratase/isomerase family protein n=1 Tax=Lentzea aerocolonigenes TaxID=68170 RepID=UPI0004C30558|nr:enoyl-CoA hydratase-related protein [Lentzea aerocolonigenes]MCP2241371.1 enoyl-CoA hydratase [Lentzea aerocolonigenes]
MDYQTLVLDEHDGVLTVTVHRPPARNALSQQTLSELRHLFSHLTGPRAVLLTGSEGPAFIAGADIREMAAMTPEEGEAFGALGQEVTRLIERFGVPVIACVDGFALGGGCEMAMACDFVYATRKAVFGQPEVLLGLIPGFGGCVRLFRRVGVAKARELIYSGRRVDAEEACRLGLVNAVFDTREEMFAAARLVLADIAANSPTAVATCKSVINEVDGLGVDDGLRVELDAFRRTFTTDDMREGTAAFLAKRTPDFRH